MALSDVLAHEARSNGQHSRGRVNRRRATRSWRHACKRWVSRVQRDLGYYDAVPVPGLDRIGRLSLRNGRSVIWWVEGMVAKHKLVEGATLRRSLRSHLPGGRWKSVVWAFDLAVDRLVQEKRVFLLGSLLTVFQPESKKSLLRSTQVEYRLPHPSDPQRHAIYGFDPTLRQYWGELYEAPAEWELFNPLTGKAMRIMETGRRRDSYDALGCRYDAARPLLGLLTWLSEHGFFSADDVTETLELLREHGSDAVPKRLRGVAQVIQDLDDAAG